MEKQIVIYVKGGCIQYVTTNFECSYQIVDYDNEPDGIGDILEPDLIKLNEEIFEI